MILFDSVVGLFDDQAGDFDDGGFDQNLARRSGDGPLTAPNGVVPRWGSGSANRGGGMRTGDTMTPS